MRILFVNSVRDRGGGLSSAVTLATALAHAGHAITLACNARGGLPARVPDDAGIRVRPMRFGPDFDPLAARALARLMRDERPDIVLADRRKDVKLLDLARRFGARSITLHRHGAPSTLRDSRAYRRIWTRLDGMIVNSHAMRRALLDATPWLEAFPPLHVVHNGVDTTRFRPLPDARAASRAALGIPEDAFVVAYAGVLQSRKRVDLLIRAAALLPDPPHLLVLGDGPERATLEQVARTRAVPATFTGHQDETVRQLAAADIAAHLSAAEGFANTVLECLACGLPVVATDEHSHPEQIDDGVTGFLVPPREDAVAAALARLRDTPAARADLARAARETAVHRFATGVMARAYTAVFDAARAHRA